jgi:predicted phage terminase large subunit-like protein
VIAPVGLEPSSRTMQAALELTRRRQARREVVACAKYVDSLFQDPAHIHLVGEKLAEVERYVETGGREGIGRLILSVPPRHGKTTIVSKRWPAFLLGRHAGWRLALVSYGADLAEDASRSVRALIRDETRYKRLFPETQLSDESQAVNRWSLAGGSADNPSLVAVGVGGPLTGRGFQVIIIDDPIKSRAEAESETVRHGLKVWYSGTLRTRLEPGGAIVLIMTRWHEDDLAGWLLEQAKIGEGEDWTVINLPALAETKDARGAAVEDPLGRADGEALWPERYTQESLLATRKAVGSYDWESQFQGHPKPPMGSKILRDWLQVIPAESLPPGLKWYRYWDLAISTKTDASYTASSRVAFGPDGELYVAAMLRGHWEWPQQKRVIKATLLAERELGVLHGVESALHGTAAVQEVRKDPELRGVAVKPVGVHVDKLTRALPWIALAEAKKVFLVQGSWVGEFIDEAAAFTGHGDAFDDQIDTVSGGVALASQVSAKVKKSKNPFYG